MSNSGPHVFDNRNFNNTLYIFREKEFIRARKYFDIILPLYSNCYVDTALNQSIQNKTKFLQFTSLLKIKQVEYTS